MLIEMNCRPLRQSIYEGRIKKASLPIRVRIPQSSILMQPSVDFLLNCGLNQQSGPACFMTTNSESAREPEAGEITRLLEEMRQGDPAAEEKLLSHVYRELRVLAACKMAREAPGQTLQPTALVHEAWLRLGAGEGARFPCRAYFFAAAGEAMRRILVEAARRKQRLKHGGNLERVDIEHVVLAAPLPDDDLLALDEALTRLAESEPRAVELVKLCYFVGLTQEQAAHEMGISVSTVERTWAYARAWLFREIRKGQGAPDFTGSPGCLLHESKSASG
jgi:RNA polymerase sigma factor (TIGR02999 family)